MDTLRGASGSDPKTLHAFRAEREGARWWHRVTVSSGLLISSLVVVAMLVLSGLLAY